MKGPEKIPKPVMKTVAYHPLKCQSGHAQTTTYLRNKCNLSAIEPLSACNLINRECLILSFIFNDLRGNLSSSPFLQNLSSNQKSRTLPCNVLHRYLKFALYVIDSVCRDLATVVHLHRWIT